MQGQEGAGDDHAAEGIFGGPDETRPKRCAAPAAMVLSSGQAIGGRAGGTAQRGTGRCQAAPTGGASKTGGQRKPQGSALDRFDKLPGRTRRCFPSTSHYLLARGTPDYAGGAARETGWGAEAQRGDAHGVRPAKWCAVSDVCALGAAGENEGDAGRRFLSGRILTCVLDTPTTPRRALSATNRASSQPQLRAGHNLRLRHLSSVQRRRPRWPGQGRAASCWARAVPRAAIR